VEGLQPPTTFDTWTGIMSAAVYVIVGAAVLARVPRDVRARTFFTVALTSLGPFLLPAFLGRIGDGTALTVAVTLTAASLSVGSVALLHFAQVFPSRRPWIIAKRQWLAAAYIVLPLGAVIGGWLFLPIVRFAAAVEGASGSGGLGAVSSDVTLLALALLIPTILVVGVVLPFAALLSLYKSWQDAKKERRDGARVTTLTILISQLAGGVLTILVVPLLHLVAPPGPWVTIAATFLFGFGLLFPIAFAIGVWKYRLIDETATQ
jgi:hypothetical protein